MAAIILYPDKIKSIVDLSIRHLIEEYREISSFYGWHQKLGSAKIGNIANAQGLLMLYYFDKEFSNKHKVIETLKKTQFTKDEIEFLGGWAFATNFSKAPSCDCTSWVLLALLNELPLSDPNIQKGINWLRNNTSDKMPNTGWGSIKNDISRTYTTCLAIRVFQKSNLIDSESYKNGLHWLINSQNHDDGWGEIQGTQSTITHTSHAVETLIGCGISKDSPVIIKGTDFILSKFTKEKTWLNEDNAGLLEFVDITVSEEEMQRISYYHFSLPWAIIALIKAEKLNYKVGFAIDTLINSNSNGNWIHPHLGLERHYTIYTKHDGLYAIKVFKECFSANWNNVRKIKISNENIQTFTKETSMLKLAFKGIYKRFLTWIILPFMLVLTGILYSMNIIEAKDIWLVIIFPILLLIVNNVILEKKKDSP